MSISRVVKNRWFIATVSFAGGAAAGLILERKRHLFSVKELKDVIDINRDIMARNTEKLKEMDPRLEELTELTEYSVPPIEPVHYVFPKEEQNDEWDYEKQRNEREDQYIYVIHRDEYAGNEMGYHQATLTYYQGDDYLVDPLNTPIYNHRELVGSELPFGFGSGDPNVVFIRNEKDRAEFEILLDTGRYEVDQLGFEVEAEYEKEDNELKHSVRKFKWD